MEMKTVSGRFTAAIELLGLANGNMQAFRFVQMEPVYQGRLRDALKKMQAAGFGEKQPTKWDRLLSFTKSVWPQK